MLDLCDVVVRVAGVDDSERIHEIMHSAGIGPGTGISEDAFNGAMTVQNIRESFGRMTWLLWDGGVVLMLPVSASACEVHVSVLEGHRGLRALMAAEIILSMIFTATPYTLVVGRTPLANKRACRFACMVGLKKVRESLDAQLASMSFFDWLATREDPRSAIERCIIAGQEAKAIIAGPLLDWIVRGEPVVSSNLKVLLGAQEMARNGASKATLNQYVSAHPEEF
jgi:hypothetical protein